MVDSNPMNKNKKPKGGGASSGPNNEVPENPNTVSKKLSVDNQNKREQESANKPSETEIKLKQRGQEIKLKQKAEKRKKASLELKREQEKRRVENQKKASRRLGIEKQEKIVSQRKSTASKIAGKKGTLEKIGPKDKSVTATGKAAVNLVKNVTDIARKTAAVPSRIATARAKAKLGRMQMNDGKDKKPDYKKAAKKGRSPEGGTAIQKARYGGAVIKRGIGQAAKKSTQRIQTAVANTRKATGRGIEKVGSGMSKLGNKLREDFIHEAEKGKKEVKKEKIDVMKGKNKIEVNPKSLPEAKKMTKRQIEKRDEIADAISTREMNKRYGDKNVKYAIATRLAMKKKKKKKITESVSGLEVQNVSDGIKFREYEFIDVVKPEPMRSPKNNITWTEGVKRDEYGDPVGGPKISKKEKQKNLAKDDKDEKITRSEETINELYGKTATRAYKAANLKSQKATNNETKNRAHRQAQKFVAYADKKYRKLNQDRSNIAKTYNKSDAVKEAKMPVQGLMKLAATVAANKKKRKNALQIQKYIGEGRRGQSKSSYNRNPYDNVTSSVKKIARTGVGPGIEITNPDEEQGIIQRRSEAEKIRQKKRDEIDKKKAEFKKKRKGLMAKGEIKSPDPK